MGQENTNTMVININDYMANDTVQEIIKETIQNSVSDWVAMTLQRKDIEVLIANTAYAETMRMLEETENSFQEKLKEKTLDVINNLSTYTVFKQPDVYDHYKSAAYSIMENTVKENAQLIKEKTKEVLLQLFDRQSFIKAITDTIINDLNLN